MAILGHDRSSRVADALGPVRMVQPARGPPEGRSMRRHNEATDSALASIAVEQDYLSVWRDGRRHLERLEYPQGVRISHFSKPADRVMAQAFVAGQMRQLEAETGVSGWVYDADMGRLCLLAPHVLPRKARQAVAGVCCRSMSGGSYGRDSYCTRPLYEQTGECKMHAAHTARRAAEQAARAERSRVQTEAWRRAEAQEMMLLRELAER